MATGIAPRMVKCGCLGLLLFASNPLESFAQKSPAFRIVRELTLGFDMRLGVVGPFHSAPYSPNAAKPGLAWSHTVIHPGMVTAVRVHLLIAEADLRAPWRLKLKDLQGAEVEIIESNSRRVNAEELWSDEIPGHGVLVELWTDGDPGGLDIVLDQYAYRTQLAFPQAIWGSDDRQPIRNATPRIQALGRPVARLRFMVSGGGQALCTGFLVTENWLLTNEHCLRTQSELLSAVMEFGYDTYASSPDRFRAESFVVPPNADLDYALVQILGSPGQQYGQASLQPNQLLSNNLGLVVIEHPGGEPKQVSIIDCKVNRPQVRGVGQGLTDFGHQCDTLGGSSGSPIFDIQAGSVVGLHHLGFTEDSPNPVNQAVYLSQILQDLQTHYPAVYQRIASHQP